MSIDIQNLAKRYGDHFGLQIPSLQIAQGETFGLVGNNGAGKTTFLRLLLDLIRADEGWVEVHQQRVTDSAKWKAEVGSYLDESFLIDFLTPEEFFAFVGNIYNLSPKEIHTAVEPYRPFLAPEIFSSAPPLIRDLSLGNKKKVGLTAAMFIKPKLLILDEPFANLDPGSQIRLKNTLRRLTEEYNTTLLLSSHDLAHVTDVCQRIAVLADGKIARDIPTSDATLNELEDFFAAA